MVRTEFPLSLFILLLTGVLVGTGFSSPVNAEIRKIVHPDGRVEYTNLSDKQRKIHYTNQKKSSVQNVYKYRNEEGVIAFSDQRPPDITFELLRFDCYACGVDSTVDWHSTPLNMKDYKVTVQLMSEKYEVPAALVRAVIHAESAYQVDAVSKAGAQGLMQLMPETAEELGVTKPFSAVQNIEGGTKYLAFLLEHFSGDERLATAAYNAGPGAVTRYKGVPPYAETEAYVERVAILRNRYADQL